MYFLPLLFFGVSFFFFWSSFRRLSITEQEQQEGRPRELHGGVRECVRVCACVVGMAVLFDLTNLTKCEGKE